MNDPHLPPIGAAAHGGALARVEDAVVQVEHVLEQTVEAAERSLARRFGSGCVRALRLTLRASFIALVVAYFVFAVMFLATRYVLMPRVDQLRPWLEREASLWLKTQVSIERIDAGWRGFNPQLRLSNVQLRDRAGQVQLALPVVEAMPSWGSVARLKLRLASLSLVAPELEIERLGPQRFMVAGFVFEAHAGADSDNGVLDWLLGQNAISVRDARVIYTDRVRAATGAPSVVEFTDLQFHYRNRIARHQFALRARPPSALAGEIDLRGDFEQNLFGRESNLAEWTGRLYAQLDYADVAAIETFTRLLPGQVRIDSGQGALRLWATIERQSLQRLTADVALTQVDTRLGEKLEPLRLDSLQGRITQSEWGNTWRGGQELALLGLSLQGTGAHALDVPPTDMKLRWTRPQQDGSGGERSEFEASRLTLESLSTLALHVPLAADLRQFVARHAARGTLTQLKLSIDGPPANPQRYALRTRFERASAAASEAQRLPDGRPRPGLPGFENLSGVLEATETGGTLTLTSRDAALDLPGVFEDTRIPVRQLLGQVRWSLQPQLQVQVENLNISNDDLELTGSASWRAGGKGAGVVDASLRLPRANVAAVSRYVPLVAGPQSRTWLKYALLGGQASDGSIRLRGDLHDFPFNEPASGDFRVALKVRGAVLDYQSAAMPLPDGGVRAPWPRIEDLDADVLLDRRRMEINGRGAIFGARIARTSVRIPDLYSKDAHLLIDGSASGPLGDMVRFVTASPLNARLGNLFATTQATGNGRLELKLDLPLTHARDALVAGNIVLANNDVALREDMPPLTRASGRVEFTERTVRIVNVSANALGGTARIDGGTTGDGAVVVNATGTATAAGARRAIDIAPVQRLLDRAQGSTRYSAVVAVRNKRTELRIESDLTGWALDAPAPLGKAASEPLPLRIELVPTEGAERDTLRVSAGTALALTLERARVGGEMKVERGVIGIGERAPLPASGVLVQVELPRLDVDRWLALFEGLGDTPAGGTRAGAASVGLPNFVNARVRQLVIAGKPLANVVLGASRGNDGAWQVNLESDQVSGALNWRPAQSGSGMRVSARLTRLSIPDTQRDKVVELLDAPVAEVPGLDVIAENFELGGKALGRLELLASNEGRGSSAAWQLQKLEISNPESKMSATGQWVREPGSSARRMALNMTLDFNNAGALLARLGTADALRAGAGRLEGDISWRGSPFNLDVASLNGQLKLNASKGQFLKASAGAGRLLGVMSLQSLPRRITLDFRDVFSEGFAFDSMTATATLANGVLETRDFKMRGVSANVLIEGSADLRNETQKLHVLVLPEINAGSASLAYALLANPAIGLGTFVAQLLLRDPLSKAFSFEYDVTGTWSDPQVKRRERPAPALSNATP